MSGRKVTIRWSVVPIALLLIALGAPAFAQAGWKTVEEKGYSFKYPSDWLYYNLEGQDYEGTTGYTLALSPPSETNFAMVIIIFPEFKLDLKADKMTYADFMKSALQGMLQEKKTGDLKIEETDAVLAHGRVPAYMVLDDQDEKVFKASMICGDLVKGRGALLVIMMELPTEEAETGKRYLDQAERIMASFTFPK